MTSQHASSNNLRTINIVETRDKSLSAQWEHMVLVTETGFEVLTLAPGETGAKSQIPNAVPAGAEDAPSAA